MPFPAGPNTGPCVNSHSQVNGTRFSIVGRSRPTKDPSARRTDQTRTSHAREPTFPRDPTVNGPQSTTAVSFSVIIPLYNKAAFVSKAINSVLSQSHREFECIIIDDGSTDDSLAVARSFSDPRITIVSKGNGGVSSARNTGLSIARCPFVAFLDADDWWTPDYLRRMAELINEYPNLSLFFCSHIAVYPNGRSELRQAPHWAEPGKSAIFKMFEHFRLFGAYNWPLHTSCCIVKTQSALCAGAFDERISLFEDYDLFSRLADSSDFAYLNSPLTFYNCDLPDTLRLTGRLPPISKSWISYMLNGKLAHSSSNDARYFIHNFAVILLLQYRKAGIELDLVREISRSLKPAHLSAGSIVRHICPVAVISLIHRVRSIFLRNSIQ